MSKALIGYTGFVGGNLDRQQTFEDRYNSKNIQDIDGKHYDTIVCAGVPAVKWLANKEPEQDREAISTLSEHLAAASTDKMVLISTVDVYPQPIQVNEDSPIDLDACQPYGKHRLQLEEFISDRFDTLIVRLPGLFGRGLKKNVIYDFLNDNETHKINPDGVFQFYYLEHLTHDIDIALKNDIRVLNVATEPTRVAEVAEVCLGHPFDNPMDSAAARYDFISRYADLFGGSGGYLYSKKQVLADLADYVQKFKEGQG